MHDDIPELAFLRANVWPAIDGLEAPPAPGEGTVHDVEFGAVKATATEGDRRVCQACGEPVAYAEEHVRATVWVDSSTGQQIKRPVFCGRGCWGDWASR